jgi:prefoldin subunit 5
MAETNGHQHNETRLDRIEAAIEHVIGEHEAFRAEHKMLLRSQILLQESLEKLKERQDATGERLDALINLVDSDHREFHARLKRLEEKQ